MFGGGGGNGWAWGRHGVAWAVRPEAPFAGAGQRRGGRPSKGEDRKINLTVHLKDLASGKAPVRLGADRTVNVTIPPEPEEGQIVRLKGQGQR